MGQGQDAAPARGVQLWVPVVLGAVILALVVALVVGLGRGTGDDGATTSVSPSATPQAVEPPSAAEGPTEPTGPAAAEQQAERPDPGLARRVPDDVTALGDVDAPVVLVEYADYRCPYCAKFGRETLPAIVEEYVDGGQVRIEWRDMPIFGEESELVAIAGRAAGNQDRFWEFNAAVLGAAPESGHPDLPRDVLVEHARTAGVPDLAAFEAALDDPALLTAVRADAAEARAIGVTSVPAFVVGSTPLLGAQPVEVFREVIAAELAGTG